MDEVEPMSVTADWERAQQKAKAAIPEGCVKVRAQISDGGKTWALDRGVPDIAVQRCAIGAMEAVIDSYIDSRSAQEYKEPRRWPDTPCGASELADLAKSHLEHAQNLAVMAYGPDFGAWDEGPRANVFDECIERAKRTIEEAGV